MFNIDEFLDISFPNSDLKTEWLEGAINAVGFLVKNSETSEIILHTNVGQAYVHSVLAKLEKVSPPDGADLIRAHIGADSCWAIEHVSGGGEPDRMYFADPLDHPGSQSLLGGEQLVFRRQFSGVDKGTVRTELSEKLIQALDLYWLDEEQAFCRLDEDGDIEPIIRLRDLSKKTGQLEAILVTIEAKHIHKYMAVTETALIMKFDFTRFRRGAFERWQNPKRKNYAKGDLFYNSGTQASASFANGVLIVRPLLTKEMLIAESRRKWDDEDKDYATFKAFDWKNGRRAEISCAPSALASYFVKDSPLPFQTTPAFFNPAVLQKYKADLEKYTLEHRAIHSRAGWFLKSYDVNESGQVHTFLCDLAYLPYREQLYWQSFNEWPKGPISQRSYETDFLGKFSTITDPVLNLKLEIFKLDQIKPVWWKPRGEEAASAVQYPITSSPEEWANAILALDQFLVEGFVVKALKARLTAAGRTVENDWGSIRLLQDCLIVAGLSEPEAKKIVDPLKKLHFLRTKVRGHHAESAKREIIKQARKDNGSLADHFQNLVGMSQASFDRIIELL